MNKKITLILTVISILVIFLIFFLNRSLLENKINKSNKKHDLQTLIDFKDKRITSNNEFLEDIKKFENNQKTEKFFKEESNLFLTYNEITKGNPSLILKESNNDKIKFIENRVKALHIGD